MTRKNVCRIIDSHLGVDIFVLSLYYAWIYRENNLENCQQPLAFVWPKQMSGCFKCVVRIDSSSAPRTIGGLQAYDRSSRGRCSPLYMLAQRETHLYAAFLGLGTPQFWKWFRFGGERLCNVKQRKLRNLRQKSLFIPMTNLLKIWSFFFSAPHTENTLRSCEWTRSWTRSDSYNLDKMSKCVGRVKYESLKMMGRYHIVPFSPRNGCAIVHGWNFFHCLRKRISILYRWDVPCSE